MKKLIFINFVIVFLLFLISELFFWHMNSNCFNDNLPFFKIKMKDRISCFPPHRFFSFNNEYKKKKPILLLGCSYAYGECIEPEDNFATKLTELSQRWVYNFGVVGQGPIHALMLLNAEKEEHLIEENPEYVIYLYMFHHIIRYYFPPFYDYYRQSNWIPFQKYNFLYRSYTYSHFKNIELEKYYNDDKNYEKRIELFFKIMTDMKKKSDELFPNSKFIFLIYSDVQKDLCLGLWNTVYNDEQEMNKLFEIMNSNQFKDRLKAENIEVVTTEELIGRKMFRPSDRVINDPNHPHPSASAWKEITPQFVKKFNL